MTDQDYYDHIYYLLTSMRKTIATKVPKPKRNEALSSIDKVIDKTIELTKAIK